MMMSVKKHLKLLNWIKNMITIYGKPNCPQCVSAKSLCESKSQEYEYKEIGKDLTVEELREICPVEIRSVPQIFKDGEYVGGYNELKEKLSC